MTDNYAKDCGCGQRNCNKGWINYNGSEYPCDGPKKSEASPEVVDEVVNEILGDVNRAKAVVDAAFPKPTPNQHETRTMTDQTEKQIVKLAKRARATAAKKYGDALRRGYLTQAVYDQLELAEAALLINQQAGSKYDAASRLVGEVVNQQWNEGCDKAIASAETKN